MVVFRHDGWTDDQPDAEHGAITLVWPAFCRPSTNTSPPSPHLPDPDETQP